MNAAAAGARVAAFEGRPRQQAVPLLQAASLRADHQRHCYPNMQTLVGARTADKDAPMQWGRVKQHRGSPTAQFFHMHLALQLLATLLLLAIQISCSAEALAAVLCISVLSAMPANIALIRRSLCATPWLAERVALYGTGGWAVGGALQEWVARSGWRGPPVTGDRWRVLASALVDQWSASGCCFLC
jgi:hypothetical protein